ncbi:MAG: hypothetical protein LW862_13995 [Rubrivivax sp.]|nr:hypothetical protein [Rubrivivax sp.]
MSPSPAYVLRLQVEQALIDDAMHHATGSVLSDAALRQQLESGHDNQH